MDDDDEFIKLNKYFHFHGKVKRLCFEENIILIGENFFYQQRCFKKKRINSTINERNNHHYPTDNINLVNYP